MTRPWPPGSATGIGAMPGTDVVEAIRLVLGELPDLPYLPELPARGAGAELIGRTASLLVALPVEIAASGWRLAAHDGRDVGRARDFLERDLDALEEQANGHTGAIKLQACGPWTLAAGLELPSGHAVVSDHGATRDLVASLAEGLRVHLADVRRRLPAATLVLQLDEPTLSAVLLGRVPTPSGYGTVRSVERTVVEQALRDVLQVADAGARVVHCCADTPPVRLIRAAGADAVALDASLLRTEHNDALGDAIDGGLSLWLGVLPGTEGPASFDIARTAVRRFWNELGFPPGDAAGAIVPTPACGLAGASPDHVRRVLTALRDTGRSLVEDGT